MPSLQTWELLSHMVTVFGLPFAIGVFLWEQRKERLAEEEELHQRLNAAYTDFLKLGACRTLAVGAPRPIFAQGKARRSAVWSNQTSKPQHRRAQKAAPALRVGCLGGWMQGASRSEWSFHSQVTQRRRRRPDSQRIPRPKSDRLLVLDNADLQMLRRRHGGELSPEQQERRQALFGILVAIFEQAYVLVYEERMNRQRQRLWQVWADYMQEWCRRDDFRSALPELLHGEDPEFADYLRRLADTAGRAQPQEVHS